MFMQTEGMPGRYPAIVQSYDAGKRTCRVSIPGITDGGDCLPEAEIEYPIGDKSAGGGHLTEIEILSGDTVWVSFIGGDPRYPIITGWRNPTSGNSTAWRRFHHENIEQISETEFHIHSNSTIHIDADTSCTVKVGGSEIVIDPSKIEMTSSEISLNGTIFLNGPITGGGSGGSSAVFTGSLTVTQDITGKADVTASGVSLTSHTHPGDSGGTTGSPNGGGSSGGNSFTNGDYSDGT